MSKGTMAIPTHSEVTAYAASIGWKLDGEYFCDYWESRGWMIKPGIRMRSWQAAVRNWKRMDWRGGDAAAMSPDAAKKKEIEERRLAVIEESAGRIAAMMSWIKSGQNPPWTDDPRGEIEDEVEKIRDHYGERGVNDLRDAVKRRKE